MREFKYTVWEHGGAESITTTHYMAGQTVAFTNGICKLVDPSPIQLAWLDEKIGQKVIVETTPKKKAKPSKPAAKKKRG